MAEGIAVGGELGGSVHRILGVTLGLYATEGGEVAVGSAVIDGSSLGWELPRGGGRRFILIKGITTLT